MEHHGPGVCGDCTSPVVQAPHEVLTKDHGTSHQAHGGGVEVGAGQERERCGGGTDEVDLQGQDVREPVRRDGWR